MKKNVTAREQPARQLVARAKHHIRQHLALKVPVVDFGGRVRDKPVDLWTAQQCLEIAKLLRAAGPVTEG